MNPFFIGLDPPRHDRMRRQVTRHFGPPHQPMLVESLRLRVEAVVAQLLDQSRNQSHIDVVTQISYPLPLQLVSDLLGIPLADPLRLRHEIDLVAESSESEFFEHHTRDELLAAHGTLSQYFMSILHDRQRAPGPDLLSRLLVDGGEDGPMPPWEIVQTAILMLLAGHETTGNLISNGVLTLLRHPQHVPRLLEDTPFLVSLVEELLRFEPPAQFRSRTAKTAIQVGETTIPQGAEVVMLLAAGNRDPAQFKRPNDFEPERVSNPHLAFGQGIHYCFGAALARIETQVALRQFFRRLKQPRLRLDPPPYRPSPALRGPRELVVDFDSMSD
jgi:cytochrome P450